MITIELFTLIGFIVIALWSQIALIVAVKDYQEKIGIIESYRRAWKYNLSYWWIELLIAIITTGGYLLFIIPGVIFSLWFLFSRFVLVAEGERGMSELLKSREYVKGRWFKIFFRLLFIGVIILAIVFTLYFDFGSGLPFLPDSTMQEVLALIMQILLYPFVMSYLFLLYFYSKKAKGDFSFSPTRGQKATFLSIGFAGVLIPIVLAGVVFFSLNTAREKAAQRVADIQTIQTGLALYYEENSTYPVSLEELTPHYVPAVPFDITTGQPYQYEQFGDSDYALCLEVNREVKCLSAWALN